MIVKMQFFDITISDKSIELSSDLKWFLKIHVLISTRTRIEITTLTKGNIGSRFNCVIKLFLS